MKRVLLPIIILLGIFTFARNRDELSSILKQPSTSPNNIVVTSEESATVNAIAKALPSVVTIRIDKTTTTPDRYGLDPFDPFSPFYRIPGNSEKIEQNIGSGFVIDKEGLIVTNKHVVSDLNATYKVLTNDKRTLEVKKISRDPLNDLAILKVDVTNLTPLQMADSSKLQLGQHVIAIGTPLGEFTNTVTSGIVSGLGRGITAGSMYEQFVERLDNVIQTDAAINPGNSGGALINLSGQVVGVNTAISGEGQNIGFAIPINVVKELIKNFDKRAGVINRPFIGIRYRMIQNTPGAQIIEVVQNSPAQKADLQEGDVITEFDGITIKNADDKTIREKIATHKVGDKLSIKIERDGEKIDKIITLEAFQN